MENKNQPAFPILKQVIGSGEDYHEIPGCDGLSKREYFAGLAMQGILASDDTDPWGNMTGLAEQSVIAADALCGALDKTKQ